MSDGEPWRKIRCFRELGGKMGSRSEMEGLKYLPFFLLLVLSPVNLFNDKIRFKP